ncbi:MAG: hypothetical protein N3A38_00995 [Planctomycetota bacterium]|nr:hypothetical protein [Planctomycetota bacterium]
MVEGGHAPHVRLKHSFAAPASRTGRTGQASGFTVNLNGREVAKVAAVPEIPLDVPGRFGFFCNGMEGVYFRNVRVEPVRE